MNRASDTVNAADRDILAKQVNEVLEFALGLSHSKFRGEFVFAGTETHETPYEAVRNAQGDIASVGLVKQNSHLPVIVDPSNAAGHHALVPTLARAAIAAGADGLIIEVHPDPTTALSDGLQSLTLDRFDALMEELRGIAHALGREM